MSVSISIRTQEITNNEVTINSEKFIQRQILEKEAVAEFAVTEEIVDELYTLCKQSDGSYTEDFAFGWNGEIGVDKLKRFMSEYNITPLVDIDSYFYFIVEVLY